MKNLIITILTITISISNMNAQSIVEIADMTADHFTINSGQRAWKSTFTAKGYFNNQFASFFYNTYNPNTPSYGATRLGIGIMNGSSFSNNTGPYIEALTILPNGFTGIGTSTPTAKLEINGDTRMSSQLRFKNGNNNSMTNAKGIIWGDAAYNNSYSRIDDDGNLRLLTDDEIFLGYLNGDGTTGGTTLYADVTKGNVGIGIVKNLTGRLHLYEPTGTSLSATTGTLVLEHGDNGGQSSILFKSAVNKNNDSGYIKFSDDGSGNGSTNENGLLEIGVGNDASNNIHTDDIALMPSGNVGIGTRKPSTLLTVNGTVTALNYAVVASVAADYVFEADYKLKTLAETEAYIKENKHLPAFKSAKHYEKEGYTITEMNIALEQTVEELTLHAIAQEKEINAMKSELAAIKAMLLAKK